MEAAPAQPVVRDDVVLTPTQPKQAIAYEPQPMPQPAHHEDPISSAPFVPPQAERPVARMPRMPRVDELPVPAQNQIRARNGEAEPSADGRRMTLLQRLATVGFGRRDEGPAEAPAPMHRPAPERPQVSAIHAEYAKRPAAPPQGYRPAQGQMAPAPRASEDDQLEIPAFLRRQTN